MGFWDGFGINWTIWKQTDNHTNTSLNFLQAEWSSCCPTNSVKAMKANPFHCTKRIIPHVFANMDHSLVNKAKKNMEDNEKKIKLRNSSVCYLSHKTENV